MTVTCPACGATGVQTSLRDARVDADNGAPDPMSYGRVHVCEACGHEWKPTGHAGRSGCRVTSFNASRCEQSR
jgi:transposase